MKNYNPKPLTEEHWHIQDLIDAQEKRVDDREYHRNKAKLAQERMDLIKDAAAKQLTAFWCETCEDDFLAEAIKEVEIDWSCPTQYIAFYRTKCFTGHWCMRLITDKHKDAYWFKSKRVKADQGKHYKDTIQPFETGFNMLYKKI